MRVIYLILIFTISLFSLTLQEIKNMPKCRERDFYIWKFIKDPKTTPTEAKEAIKLANSINYLLKKAYKKKTGRYPPRKRRYSSSKEAKKYKSLIGELKKRGDFYKRWLRLSDYKKLKLFSYMSRKDRRRFLNRKIPKDVYLSLTERSRVNTLIDRAFRDRLHKLKWVILNTPPKDNNRINFRNLMKLGLINMKMGKRELASKFFYYASLKAPDKFGLDRAIFWRYLATKDKKYLERVADSYDINLYKLIALDFLNRPYPIPKTPIVTESKKVDIDIRNPIDWAKLKMKIFSKKYNLYKLAEKYKSKETMGHYLYILTKASNHKKQFFPVLYKDTIKDYPIKRQALILAIAKQESEFIPAAISRSFALGLMQFMPFLIEDIAKKSKMDIELEDIFEPKLAIKFANRHLNYLNKHLYHPLFVAYAYNGGIGYTRRILRKSTLFKGRGEFEPYLSLELLDNEETKKYGKKVLANYVIYRHILNRPVKITTLLEQLDKPHLTDRFRKR